MTGHSIDTARSEYWRLNCATTARRLADTLTKAGYNAKPSDHGYAVRLYVDEAKTERLAIVWLPIGEPTPTGLGDKYLWGRTGDEHQAPDSTELPDLVEQIVSTLR